MNILVKAFGELNTNCYIITNNMHESIIIDPGEGSEEWIICNISDKPLAILNTHAHYDHVMGNGRIQKELNIPLIIHEDDVYLLDCTYQWQKKIPKCIPTYRIIKDTYMKFGDFEFKIITFPGHTLGTCIYDFGFLIFSGDFVMDNTVGRYNLFTSDRNKQFCSLKKFMSIYEGTGKEDIVVYPGHGKNIKMKEAVKTVKKWITFFN